MLALPIDDATLPAHSKKSVAIEDEAVAGSRRGQRRGDLPSILLRPIDVMQIGIILKSVEASANDMNRAIISDAADMIARTRQRLTD